LIKAIKILIEIIGWLAIAGGTTLGAGIISLIVYSKSENEIIALTILIVGFIIGAIWATRISMKYGTMEWLSGVRRIS
jgi:glucose uptake protein GlcU